jgi:hypothetical protein
MKKITFLFTMLYALLLSSCVKDEALNMEADITGINLSDDQLLNDDILLLDPLISNNAIVLYVRPGIDLKDLKVDFDLTPGAAVSIITDSLQKDSVENDMNKVILKQYFDKGVYYKTTSEDGQFSKNYLVKMRRTEGGLVPLDFGFEQNEIDKDNKYVTFYDVIDGVPFYNWASGNPSFSLTLAISGVEPRPDAYPTKTTTDSHSGDQAVLLETKSTGSFGALFGKPIAAGNLFIGSFDPGPVLTDPLAATRFGMPFNKIPLAIEGYFKYTAGSVVTDAKMNVLNMKDSCDIYAVLYNRKQLVESQKEAKKTLNYLTGHNILKDPSVVAIAKLQNGAATSGVDFTKFSIPFIYSARVDDIAIASLDYNIAIVMSSSKYGDRFIGAVGSKLIIDDLKVITK